MSGHNPSSGQRLAYPPLHPDTRDTLDAARRFLSQLTRMHARMPGNSPEYRRGVADLADGFDAYLGLLLAEDGIDVGEAA